MNRRKFIGLGAAVLATQSAGFVFAQPKAKSVTSGKNLTEKQILREGQPATIANYCEHPDKQPNKFCPGAKDKPGSCSKCQFFNKDNSETTFKGGKYARCQLLADASKPQFVSANGWCATFVPKA
jgi:hypothetical protein